MRKIKWILLFCLAIVGSQLKAQDSLAVAVQDTIRKQIVTTHYANRFEGRKTTSGQRYRGAKFTAAHRTLPFGTMVKVTNLKNGKSVVVKVNDRGPFSKRFSLDVSKAAAKTLGFLGKGYTKVEIAYVLKN
jgi:rare lipoprotein A